MSAPTLSKGEATIAKVLEAAAELFVERNYADVKMDDIAEAARLTKGALYHHFSSKQELYLAMMHADLEEKERLFSAAIDEGTNAHERLSLLTRAFLELSPLKRSLISLVRRDSRIFDEPARGELIRAYQRALPELVEKTIWEGVAQGEIKPIDARLLSWDFVALVEISLSFYADSVFTDVESKLNHVIDLFFYGAADVGNGEGKWKKGRSPNGRG